MTKIRFYLKNQTGCKESSIFMMLNYGHYKIVNGRKKYLPLKYYIGESISPVYWNKRTNRVRETKMYPQHTLFNQRLSYIENLVQTLLLNFKHYNGLIVAEKLREALNMHIKNRIVVKQEKKMTLFSFIKQFINESEKIKSIATVRQYKNTFRLLVDFSTKVQQIDFHDINMFFYANFKNYMNIAGHSETYFGNQIKYIRLFMNEATERGYNSDMAYKSRKFIAPQSQSDKIYLTTEEVERIRLVKLSGHAKLEKIRDMFVIACKTGLRFSDLVRLHPSNFIMSEKILRIKTQKTSAVVYIPLSPETLLICEKYNYHLPRLSNSTFNAHLKEIGRRAGLTEEIETFVSKGSRRIRQTQPKYQLITSHTARRSFATNAFLASVPNISIMQITGHTTEKAFMKYIRISGEDNARRLLSHPHFVN